MQAVWGKNRQFELLSLWSVDFEKILIILQTMQILFRNKITNCTLQAVWGKTKTKQFELLNLWSVDFEENLIILLLY